MSNINQIRCISYNCRGWKSGSHFISKLLTEFDICFIQEHWLLKEQLGSLLISNDFLSIANSGMDSFKLLKGRPYGGTAILFRKNLTPFVKRINCNAKRFCGFILELSSFLNYSPFSILCISVYLPTDYGNPESNSQFLHTVCELEAFISMQSCDNIIICGDLNVDFSRSTPNKTVLIDFMLRNNLTCTDLSSSNVSYTYRRDDGSATSWPDHIMTKSLYDHLLSNVASIDSAENFSDHLPISFSLNVSQTLHVGPPSVELGDNPPVMKPPHDNINWNSLTDKNISAYCKGIRNSLPQVPSDVLNCCQPECTEHLTVLDSICSDILQCIEASALNSLPKTKAKSSRVIGWNDSAAHLKDKANFWHKVWQDSGCPSSGVLHAIKKSTKNRYKHQIRRLKRRQEYLERAKMGIALSQSKQRDFWKEVHLVNKVNKGHSSSDSASIVDNASTQADISHVFAHKMKSLLNSCDSQPRDECYKFIADSLTSLDLMSVSITPSRVNNALSRLKRGKSDGTNLTSNHFALASAELVDVLSRLFTAILRHGYMPKCIRDCTVRPVPKPGKDPTVSDNYRPIALAPTLSKILESCILLEFEHYSVITSDLQLGFKSGLSTDMCTGLIKNAVSRHLFNNTKVYGCFLDASKAFDRVDHTLLFNKFNLQEAPSPSTQTSDALV